MKKAKRNIVVASATAVVAMGAFWALGRGGEEVELQTQVAAIGSIRTIASGSGALEGVACVEISAARQGLIDSIYVEEGDTVHAGQTLLTLDDTEALAELRQARASSTGAGIALDRAEREYRRMSALSESGLSCGEELACAREDLDAAQAELSRVSAVEVIAVNGLDETVYRSPIDGVVTALNVEQGEMAVMGTMNNAGTVLLTVEDMSGFILEVTMVESEVIDVLEGMEAEIVLDALPDSVFRGHVTNIALASSNDAGGEEVAEYAVMVAMDERDPRMRSGMSASVDIVITSVDSCIVLPIQSIVSRPDPADPARMTDCVLRLSDGTVEAVPVVTGVTDILTVEVSGVREGDVIVTGPMETLRTLAAGSEACGSGDSGDGDDEGGIPLPGMGGPPPGAQGPPPGASPGGM
ncbi:MAG: efflux RND transporter periplasmic adaptor subunit [Candidatus Fermentibacter sp.]|nr:efflux RND transporter periplasmic adaptor subunit [Candidatus Fermentibacter sp.]